MIRFSTLANRLQRWYGDYYEIVGELESDVSVTEI